MFHGMVLPPGLGALTRPGGTWFRRVRWQPIPWCPQRHGKGKTHSGRGVPISQAVFSGKGGSGQGRPEADSHPGKEIPASVSCSGQGCSCTRDWSPHVETGIGIVGMSVVPLRTASSPWHGGQKPWVWSQTDSFPSCKGHGALGHIEAWTILIYV